MLGVRVEKKFSAYLLPLPDKKNKTQQLWLNTIKRAAKMAGARDGDWRRWLRSSDVTFLRKSQGLVKRYSYFMQAVCTLLWIECFETYTVVT